MTKTRNWNLLLLAFLAGGIYLLQAPRVDLARRTPEALTAPPVLPLPEAMQYLNFGLRNLLADWYWLQFVQYFGDTVAREKTDYSYSDDYLELVTRLDPQFVGAYGAAGYAVAQSQNNPAQALRLMERGIALNRDKKIPLMWTLYQRTAGVAFLYEKDFPKAARYFEEAVQQPDAPKVLLAFAAAFYRASNNWDRAIPLWIDVYTSSPALRNRESAQTQLLKMGVWLDQWGDRPDSLELDASLLKSLKVRYCPGKNLTPQPLPGFRATYYPPALIEATCRP